ncbi:tryptophan halogenase [Haloferax sp. Atlit-4N]|uniref:tryptophan 7-halogenase n=1 Tax=Haloferax sp. Atlit-4N TaxID=2077206 RepID=UPI000E2471BA|nr:tryptophan 7-halogenase [Haloferax sp. Atlit-4N]RDZ51369.1 tryptophan halogenase [Haloferax sp. Atlit-4N]
MSDYDRTINEILVVGGGDIGLLTSLCIKKLNPDIDVAVVDDFSEDPPEVGKSTYQEIIDIFHEFLEIDEMRFLKEVKPIWKSSVFFRNWTEYGPFHYSFDDIQKYPDPNTSHFLDKAYLYYHELYSDPECQTINEWLVELGKSPINFEMTGEWSRYGPRAYHLDLNRFNEFLQTICGERGINLIDDIIETVETGDGRVTRVQSDQETYEADLYVDATGFRRVLLDEFDVPFRNFDLPLDAALSTKFERPLSEVEPATVIESGDNGWFWQIDTYEFRDVGYVYATDFVDAVSAKAEFVEYVDGDISADELECHEFQSGYYEQTWTGNLVAIGNAGGFIEPLQSTGLTSNTKNAVQLAHLLSAYGSADYPAARETYNGWVTRQWETVYDFISVHYKYANGDTPFWKQVQSMPVSERVTRIKDHFESCGYAVKIDPIQTPKTGQTPLIDSAVFPTVSYLTILRNLEVQSDFYETLDLDVSEEARTFLEEYYRGEKKDAEAFLTHEEFYKGVLFDPW